MTCYMLLLYAGGYYRRAFGEKEISSLASAVSRNQIAAGGKQEGLYTWRVRSEDLTDNWRTLGDVFAEPRSSRSNASPAKGEVLRFGLVECRAKL